MNFIFRDYRISVFCIAFIPSTLLYYYPGFENLAIEVLSNFLFVVCGVMSIWYSFEKLSEYDGENFPVRRLALAIMSLFMFGLSIFILLATIMNRMTNLDLISKVLIGIVVGFVIVGYGVKSILDMVVKRRDE